MEVTENEPCGADRERRRAAGLVMAGAVGAALTVSVKLWVALEPTPFAAVIVIG